ncbi:MAG TPA: UpxY family transcription antiterminator, partial [Rhodothermales bacterium]|nr:UpxY family transcription antiterminator [Rhodothermales bacterium]
MFDRSQAWRIFCTRSRAEKRVEESLERQAVEVFLPKYAEVHQWKDRKKQVVLPLFPGYIFAHDNERERLDVLRVDGVVRTLTMDGQLCT